MGRSSTSLVALLLLSVAGCAAEPAGDEAEPSQASESDLHSVACTPLSSVPGMRTFRLGVDGARAHLRVGIASPEGTPRGDVLYLHGFGDRFDNHLPLFARFTAQGYRVVAFDFPSHGETCGHPIDGYGFGDLGAFAAAVEEATREDASRPLVLSGWSTGGLLAVRMLQDSSPALERPVAGAVLFAPAVAPRALVGEFGFLTNGTLTRNPSPPHRGALVPRSPLLTPLFAPALLANAKLAQCSAYPTNVPTLVVVGGEDTDRYVDTDGVRAWASHAKDDGAAMYGRSCAGGFHELDNEPGTMGPSVREAAASFAAWAGDGAEGAPPPAVTRNDGACQAF